MVSNRDHYEKKNTKGIKTMKMSDTLAEKVLFSRNENFTFDGSTAADNTFIEISDDFKEKMILKAKIFLSNKKYDEALVACQSIIDRDPDYSEAYVGQGFTYIELGLWNSGKCSLQKAARLGNKNAIALLQTGIVKSPQTYTSLTKGFSLK
jgi:tetratricopeptide (TPR) repeat protein